MLTQIHVLKGAGCPEEGRKMEYDGDVDDVDADDGGVGGDGGGCGDQHQHQP